MIYIIIGIVIGFILGFKHLETGIPGGVLGCIGGFVCGLLFLLTAGHAIGLCVPANETVAVQELIPLNESIEHSYVEQKYALGTTTYRYMTKSKDGNTIEEVVSGDVYVYEGDYEPAVVKHRFSPKRQWYDWFCIPNCHSRDYIQLYIPKK